MQPYDVLMLILLIGTALHGAYKGFAWQLASLTALIASALVAMRFSDQLAPYLSSQTPWNKFLAMLLLYLATSFVVWMLFGRVSALIDRVQLQQFDRQLGLLFGFAKGVLYSLVITFFIVTMWGQGREYVLQSRSGYYMATFIHQAESIMPKEARDVLGPYLDRLERGLDPKQPGPDAPVR